MALDWLEQLKKKAEAGQSSAPASGAPSTPEERPSAEIVAGRAPEGNPSFTGLDPAKRRQRAFRLAFDHLAQFSPPPHFTEERADAYWRDVLDSMTRTAIQHDNDPLLLDMLVSVFRELERESGLKGIDYI